MILRKFARALLMIATGSLACGLARADSVIVAAIGETGPGFDNRLPALYSDDQTKFELASNSPFDLAGNLSGTIGLGSFTLASEPLAEAAFAFPFNSSGAWATSFSNLSLPAGVYSQSVSDPLAPHGFHDWGAALPPDFEIARDDWMMFFSDLSSTTGDYWALLREPLASPDFRTGQAEMPPAFEMARDWEIEPWPSTWASFRVKRTGRIEMQNAHARNQARHDGDQ
jgi:hypothetical protein